MIIYLNLISEGCKSMYDKVESEGSKQKGKIKIMGRLLYEEEVVHEKGNIVVKCIPRSGKLSAFAQACLYQMDIPKQYRKKLTEWGFVEGTDYTIEVK